MNERARHNSTLEKMFEVKEHKKPSQNDEGGQIWRVMDFHQKAAVGYWVTMLHEAEQSNEVREYTKSTLGDTLNNWGQNHTALSIAKRCGSGETLLLGEKYYLAAWFVWYGFPPLITQTTKDGSEVVTRAQARQRIPAPHRTPVLIEPTFDKNGNPKFTIPSSHNYA